MHPPTSFPPVTSTSVRISSAKGILERPNFAQMPNLQYNFIHVIEISWRRHEQNL